MCEHFGSGRGIVMGMLILEHHQISTPFKAGRLAAPAAIRRLMISLEREGQRQPVVVVRGASNWDLVDGYRRCEALRRLRVDTITAECWECALPEAVARVITRHQGRTLEPIEQAWLLRTALEQGGSQRQLAQWLGQDPSWISRRLALLSGLTEPMQEAVQAGVVSCWAASRVLVPLARANTQAATQLLERLREKPMATRELQSWYQTFQRSTPVVRERLLQRPDLFQATQQASPDDPNAAWLRQAGQVRHGLRRLRDTLADLLTPRPPPAVENRLRATVDQLQAALRPLEQLWEAFDDAQRDRTGNDSTITSERDGDPSD